MIRPGSAADAAELAEIYNWAVTHSTAIWNDVTVDAANRAAWLLARQEAGYPVLVAVDSLDRAIGYASYGPFRAFDGYKHTVEHSVYVHADHRGAGLGSQLMRALIEHARADGRHVMVAAIDASNTGSIALHERLGFTHQGTMPEVGTKFGRWLDLALLQLRLGDEPSA